MSQSGIDRESLRPTELKDHVVNRMTTVLSPSEIEFLRQEAKADHLRVMEILANEAKDQAT
jgi:hypothetical protein